jgi:hypothetical protein
LRFQNVPVSEANEVLRRAPAGEVSKLPGAAMGRRACLLSLLTRATLAPLLLACLAARGLFSYDLPPGAAPPVIRLVTRSSSLVAADASRL